MRQELDKALCERYPLIFADRNLGPAESPMSWGFECGDGWYNIIDTLCAAIQGQIDQRNKQIAYRTKINDMIWEYGHGNREPLLEYAPNNFNWYLKMGIQEVPDPITQVVAQQVKEKFGGLRFYYSGGDDTIHAYVTFAEYLSERTCDVCGAPGKQSGGGWIVTRCKEHEV